jgi:Gas vesicle synthesis protein GvpL/GvpF
MSAQAKPKYVYGVVPKAAPVPRGTGIRRSRLHAVEDGELAAIVSDAPEGDIQAGREELLTHARVLERARDHGVVLPMRFGVVMPDEDAVRHELLEGYRDELLLQMRELAGKAELRLRAVYDQDALMKEIVEAHSDIAGLSAALRDRPVDAMYYERIELGQKVAAAVEQAATVDLSAILDALEPLAVATQVGEPDHEHVAANVSFLVEEEQIPAFDAAVDDLGGRNAGRLRFKYTGPLPPYSFVELPAQE